MLNWWLLVQEGRKTGHTFSQSDLIVAATGRQHGPTVVSRDTTEYLAARAPVFNAWTDAVADACGSQA